MLWWGIGIALAMFGGLLWAPSLSRMVGRGAKVVPERPRAFGYRMAWVAVKTRDTAKLIHVLELANARSSGWSAGVATVYSERFGLSRVFVTPPVDGWSHVVGLSLPHPMADAFEDLCAPFLIRLSREFGPVNYYASLPDLGYFAWAYLRNGEMNRGFACGAEGVLWNRGAVLPDERAIGLGLFNLQLADRKTGLTKQPISERHVLELASRWSLDPTQLEAREQLTLGLGYLARSPAGWRPVAVRRQAA